MKLAKSKKRKKKFSYMLLEVMIALSVLGMLLFVLFNFYLHLTQSETKTEKMQKEITLLQNGYFRLQSIFGNIYPEEEKNFAYEEKECSFLIIFHNGIDPDPKFSGPIFAKIRLENSHLSLTLSPLERSDSSEERKEILLENISTINYLFLEKIEEGKKGKKLKWESKWKEKSEMPLAIRMQIITKDKKEKNFTFFTPSNDDTIDFTQTENNNK